MAKKPLGTDSMGIQKTMRIGDYLADCGGQFALNAMTGLVSAVLYFYTEKVGVAAATAANVLLAAKIVDAFTDLIMGKIMDNGKSPKGKCRPWFLRMAIPAFVAIVALFTVPAGLTGFAQVAYLFLSNVFLTAIVSTAIMIPYSAILVMRTKSLEERNKMGIFRAAAGYVIGMVIAIALVPLTNMLGSNGVADQAAYIKFAVVVGALSMIFLFSWVSIFCALVSWSRKAAAVSFSVCCSGCIPSFSAVSASCRAVSSVVAFCRATFVVESVDRLPLSSLTRARRAALPSMTAWSCACSARLASICACKSARSVSSSVLLRESCSDAISTSSA